MMMAAGYQRNAENYLLRARYDRYFGDNSIFVSPLFFRDTFAGFAARASGQLGYLRNFLGVTQWSILVEIGKISLPHGLQVSRLV